MFQTTYWVLRLSDDKTIAICADLAAADWIVAHYPEKCVLRITVKR